MSRVSPACRARSSPRARQILGELEDGHLHGESSQLALFSALQRERREPVTPPSDPRVEGVLEALRGVDIAATAPLDALILLGRLQAELAADT